MIDLLINNIFLSSFLSVVAICMTTSLWGAILLVDKKSLLSETLAHAVYPGILFGILISGYLYSSINILFIVGCGLITSFLGSVAVTLLEKSGVNKDSSLCFVLVSFFGVGAMLASIVRNKFPFFYSRVNAYLYGQSATLGFTETVYALLMLIVSLIFIFCCYRYILSFLFDESYAEISGVNIKLIKILVLILISLVVVSGVRCVGVVLISSMFVAPALAARSISNSLKHILIISSIIGGTAGALGSLLSVIISLRSNNHSSYYLPTGPLIVVIAGFIALLFMIFSPSSGSLIRFYRRKLFSFNTSLEHLLKVFWYEGGHHQFLNNSIILESLRYKEYFGDSSYFLPLGLWCLKIRKLIYNDKKRGFVLTAKGLDKAARLVRLHRLWESYLVYSLGFCKTQVHPLAEEIEHILDDDLERVVLRELNDTNIDPHNQIIPKKLKEKEE